MINEVETECHRNYLGLGGVHKVRTQSPGSRHVSRIFSVRCGWLMQKFGWPHNFRLVYVCQIFG
jgi:hypothetical protein